MRLEVSHTTAADCPRRGASATMPFHARLRRACPSRRSSAVEQLIRNQQVLGSIPSAGSIRSVTCRSRRSPRFARGDTGVTRSGPIGRSSILGWASRSCPSRKARRTSGERVRVFGSVARGESTPRSGVDSLIRLKPGHGFSDFMAFCEEAERVLGRRLDVVTEDGLSHTFAIAFLPRPFPCEGQCGLLSAHPRRYRPDRLAHSRAANRRQGSLATQAWRSSGAPMELYAESHATPQSRPMVSASLGQASRAAEHCCKPCRA